MSKLTRRELHQLQDFISTCNGGVCCSLNAWSTGRGRYTRVKTLPPFVYKVDYTHMYGVLSPIAIIAAVKWLRSHNRNVYVLCLDIMEMSSFLEKYCLGKEVCF